MSVFPTPLEHQVIGPARPGAPKLEPKATGYFLLVAGVGRGEIPGVCRNTLPAAS